VKPRFTKAAPVLLLLIAALSAPAFAATDTTVSGVVRDAKGAPQVGALVQLVRPDLSVIAQTFTDDHGRYVLPRIVPGTYGVKATSALLLPTLRENLHIAASSKLIVNLTLSTLYDAFRWLPAQPRQADEPKDDWTWTLRLSANRPLLRLLREGPLVVVNEADRQSQNMKARMTIRGGESAFGEGGVHNDFEMRRTTDDTRQLILRADLSAAESPALNTEVGYEQQLGPGRTLRTVAAFVDSPEIAGGPGTQGMQAMVIRTAETMELTDAIEADFGNEMEAVHLGQTRIASYPSAGLRVRAGDSAIAYRVATAPGVLEADAIDRESSLPPAVAQRQGSLVLEHGLHQELSYTHTSGNARLRVTVFRDNIEHPMINGAGEISAADWAGGDLLYDGSTDAIRVSGPQFTGGGMVAEFRDVLPDATWIAITTGTGNVISMDGPPSDARAISATLAEELLNMKPRQAQMVAAAFGGKLQKAGTQWQASYRWQSTGSLTAVDSFNNDLPDPYLSFYVRQPIHCRGVLNNGMEALLDVRNLLAQGYMPFVSRDGSVLYFAQASRTLEGGLSFTF
jgi:hypothetical protein